MNTIVLRDNVNAPHTYRKEARPTEKGLVLVSTQKPEIGNLNFERIGYDYTGFHLTRNEMDMLVEWWTGIAN